MTVTCVALVAATVNVDEDSALMVAGLALIVTVGAGCTFTVMVAVALAVAPLLAVATAVYVVVALGLTACVPPASGRLYVVPSVPVTVTCVALIAIWECRGREPAGMAGLATMLTTGRRRLLPKKGAPSGCEVASVL